MNSAIFMFLLLTFTTCLYLPSPVPLPSTPPTHQGSLLMAAVNSSPQQYLTFIRFMHSINSLTNNAGFIRRTLILNYQHQFTQLQTVINEVYVGIKAIKQVLINNHLLVSSLQPMCPQNGTFNSTDIKLYLEYTLQKERIALNILKRTPQLVGLVGSALELENVTNSYADLVI